MGVPTPGWFLPKSVQTIERIGVAGNLELRRVCKLLKTNVGLGRMGTTERDEHVWVRHGDFGEICYQVGAWFFPGKE